MGVCGLRLHFSSCVSKRESTETNLVLALLHTNNVLQGSKAVPTIYYLLKKKCSKKKKKKSSKGRGREQNLISVIKGQSEQWTSWFIFDQGALSLYLHNNDFHTENFIFSAGFICNISKLVDFWRIHLLGEAKKELKNGYIKTQPYRHIVTQIRKWDNASGKYYNLLKNQIF